MTEKNGEPGRDRTYDNLIKSQVLYQLSYGPSGRRPALGGGRRRDHSGGLGTGQP